MNATAKPLTGRKVFLFIASCSNNKEAKLTLSDPDIQKMRSNFKKLREQVKSYLDKRNKFYRAFDFQESATKNEVLIRLINLQYPL